MKTLSKILTEVKNAALAREPGPVFLIGFMGVTVILFIIAYQIGAA